MWFVLHGLERGQSSPGETLLITQALEDALKKTHISTDVVELGDEGVLDNIHRHLRRQHHHNIGEQHPQVVWNCNDTVWRWMTSTWQQQPAALGGLPGFQENCSMFLRQTMSRRMQLVNLSLISVKVGKQKKVNQSWINPTAHLDYIILHKIDEYFTVLGSFQHLPLFDIWNKLFFSNFLKTLPLISTNYGRNNIKIWEVTNNTEMCWIQMHMLIIPTLLDIMMVSRDLLWELKATFRVVAWTMMRMAWRTKEDLVKENVNLRTKSHSIFYFNKA